MRKVVDDIRLMTKVCDLYYNQDASQQEIAKMLQISRPTISRLLSSARQTGIVKITVSNLEGIKYWDLENQLKAMYRLREIIITDTMPTSAEQKEVLGKAAGRYLGHLIKDGDVVGISMGGTLHYVVENISGVQAKDVTVVSTVGGLGRLRMDLHSNTMAETLARACNGRFVPMHAPARVSSKAIRDELMKEDSLAEALRYAEKLDISLEGIGYPNPGSSIRETGYYQEDEVRVLQENQMAGEIMLQFFDIEGNTSPYTKHNNRVIGLSLQKLRKVPVSIGVAGGMDKVNAIQGAIAGGFINTLITDYDCAMALYERAEEAQGA